MLRRLTQVLRVARAPHPEVEVLTLDVPQRPEPTADVPGSVEDQGGRLDPVALASPGGSCGRIAG